MISVTQFRIRRSNLKYQALVHQRDNFLAELINENASTELEILIETGMLLETLPADAQREGISEDGDPYDYDA
jgi:hypothetical protein